MGCEPAPSQQQQHVVGVVYLLVAQPAVAVVPLAHPLPVQTGQLGAEHRVQVMFGIAADRRVHRIEGYVGKIVQLREEVHLRELADAGEEREPHVRVAVLDHAIQAAQEVAVGARHFGVLQRVQDRFVVLVDQHCHALPGLPVQGPDQVSEPLRCGVVAGSHACLDLDVVQLRRQVGVQVVRRREMAPAKA